MVLNAEKRKQLAAMAAQMKAAPGPSALGPSTKGKRLKGVAEVAEVAPSEDEDTCSDLVFRRKRKADVAVPMPSGLDEQAPFYRECPLVPPLPVTSWCRKVEGRVLQGVTVVSPLLICPPSYSRLYNPSRPRRG